jgi:RNA polymerase sigma-70 factor (ECF subfamily)
MAKETDADALLHQAVAGDGDALEALLLQCFDRLAAEVARRMPADVRGALSPEDVVQDTFIVAFQRIRDFEPRGERAFLGWLTQIAANRLSDAVKALRAAKRGGGWGRLSESRDPDSTDLIHALELLPGRSRSPSRSAAVDEALAALEAALDGLDPDYRDALRMRYIEMQPVASCAARLGRSEGAVHMLLSRALAALRARMGDSARYFSRKG